LVLISESHSLRSDIRSLAVTIIELARKLELCSDHHTSFRIPSVPMLLGLTILLVLLAWTLGNTITRSTNTSSLESRTHQTFSRRAASGLLGVWHSSHSCWLAWVIALLRRIESQVALALASPRSDQIALQIATTSRPSERFTSLIGRNFVWFRSQQDYRAQSIV